MIITCQNQECNFDIHITDEKLPKKPIRIACPKCKSPNIVYPAGHSREENEILSDGQPGQDLTERPSYSPLRDEILAAVDQKLAAVRQEILSVTEGKRSERGHEFPPGGNFTANAMTVFSKKALICGHDDDARRVIKDEITKTGFISDEISAVEDALKILKKSEIDYDLIFVEKAFPADEEGGYKVLAQLAALPLNIRRKIYVVFVSADLRTSDTGTAFLLGANSLVNKRDLSKLSLFLKVEMEDYDKLYGIFTRCLRSSKESHVR